MPWVPPCPPRAPPAPGADPVLGLELSGQLVLPGLPPFSQPHPALPSVRPPTLPNPMASTSTSIPTTSSLPASQFYTQPTPPSAPASTSTSTSSARVPRARNPRPRPPPARRPSKTAADAREANAVAGPSSDVANGGREDGGRKRVRVEGPQAEGVPGAGGGERVGVEGAVMGQSERMELIRREKGRRWGGAISSGYMDKLMGIDPKRGDGKRYIAAVSQLKRPRWVGRYIQ